MGAAHLALVRGVAHQRARSRLAEISAVEAGADAAAELVDGLRPQACVATRVASLHTGDPDRDALIEELTDHSPALVLAAHGGSAEAARSLAVRAGELGNLDLAIAWFTFAANLGDAVSASEAEELTDRWLAARTGWWQGEPGVFS